MDCQTLSHEHVPLFKQCLDQACQEIARNAGTFCRNTADQVFVVEKGTQANGFCIHVGGHQEQSVAVCVWEYWVHGKILLREDTLDASIVQTDEKMSC